eukprot:scaffold14305_cov33-Tisochrysis_lutea.AAC.1
MPCDLRTLGEPNVPAYAKDVDGPFSGPGDKFHPLFRIVTGRAGTKPTKARYNYKANKQPADLRCWTLHLTKRHIPIVRPHPNAPPDSP